MFPRRRRNEREIDSNRREEIVLTAADITNMFYMRQAEAAESLVSLMPAVATRVGVRMMNSNALPPLFHVREKVLRLRDCC